MPTSSGPGFAEEPEFPCTSRGGAAARFRYSTLASGALLTPAVVEAMLAQTRDFNVEISSSAWTYDVYTPGTTMTSAQGDSILTAVLDHLAVDFAEGRARLQVLASGLLRSEPGERALAAFVGARSPVIVPEKVMAAAKAGNVDVLPAVVAASEALETCARSASKIASCETRLAACIGRAEAGWLKQEFLVSVSSAVQRASLDASLRLAMSYRAWGLDTRPFASSLCERARVAEDEPTADATLAAAAKLDPQAACIAATSARRWRANTLGVTWRVLLMSVPFPALFRFYRRKWRAVRLQLATPSQPAAGEAQAGAITRRLQPDAWRSAFISALAQLRTTLEHEETGEAGAAASALARIMADERASEMARRRASPSSSGSSPRTQPTSRWRGWSSRSCSIVDRICRS